MWGLAGHKALAGQPALNSRLKAQEAKAPKRAPGSGKAKTGKHEYASKSKKEGLKYA